MLPFWEDFRPPGGVLGALGGFLARLGAILGPLGGILLHLGVVLAYLGGLLGRLGGLLGLYKPREPLLPAAAGARWWGRNGPSLGLSRLN